MKNSSKFDVRDNIKQKQLLQATTKLQIILTIFICLKTIFYANIGAFESIKYFMLVNVIVGSSIIVELVYHLLVNKLSSLNAIETIKSTNPQIPGLLIASTINYGFSFNAVIICTIVGLFIARMLFSEHKHQIICSPAFVMVLLHSTYPKMALNISNTTTFNFFNSAKTEMLFNSFNINKSIGLDLFPYLSISDMILMLSLLALIIILFRNLNINYSIALKIFLFLFLMSYSFICFLDSTNTLQSSTSLFGPTIDYISNFSEEIGNLIKSLILLSYIIFGQTATGIVLYCAYTKALPTTRIGTYISAFIIALLIFYTKIFTSNPYGFFYALVLCNLLTPTLEETIVCTQINRNITIISLILLSLSVGFVSFFVTMSGV